jgi:hypothetical protein
MFSDVRSVWDWLFQQTDQRLFYVRLLNVRTPEQLSTFLNYLVPLAQALQSEAEIVRSLINGELGGWRSSVIGTALAILQVVQ